MKTNRLLATLSACLLMLLASTAVMAKDKRQVERGMTKQEVTEILGKPRNTSFDETGERWEYVKYQGGLFATSAQQITVVFDRTDRVTQYQSKEMPLTDSSNTGQQQTQGQNRSYQQYGRGHQRSMADADFSILVAKVKRKSFKTDKLDLIEVACLGGYFTCQQCARLIDLFSFSSEKLEVVKLMAPHIVDAQNSYAITSRFTFSSDKDKAAQLLQRR